MSSPQVTVLTAVHNGARYLPETIACIKAQTFTDWEYILVDDNSDDQTCKLIEDARRSDNRLRLLRRKHTGGPYAAANDGLREAHGQYIVRIDADDLCTPNRVDKQLQFLADHPEFRACVSYWQGFNESGARSEAVTSIPRNSRVFRWSLLLRNHVIHSSGCIKRDAIVEIGGYRELPLSQDYRLWCELARRGWLGTIPEVLCFYRFHEKRQTVKNRSLQSELALGVISDHILSLTGETWTRQDLEALRDVGLSLPMPIHKGMQMLDRWERIWQSATDLTVQDRRELKELSSLRRWKHLRANVRNQPSAALIGLLRWAVSGRFLHGLFRSDGGDRKSAVV